MNVATPTISAISARERQHTRGGDFYELTKPRMNFLVVVTTAVGFYMATKGRFDFARLLHTLLGTVLTAASAAVLNQIIERGPDALMPRTADRPIPTGRITIPEALWFGIPLGIIGIAWLALAVNILTALLGATTLLSYIFIYTPLKRITSLNTVIGAIPGAIPPVMGFTAVHGALSPQALALFGILFVWQMPHFLAIAILYRDDYAKGGFKMLPVVDRELTVTGFQIILYSIALIPVTLLPSVLDMAGPAYFCLATLIGLAFLTYGISAATSKTRLDARKLFFASIIYLPVLLAAMMINKA